MPSSLPVDLRDAYREAAAQLPEADRVALSRVRVLSNAGPPGRAAALSGVVTAYRAGPKTVWAPVLLDLIAPAILARLRRLKPEMPVLDLEDVRQQFLLEVLLAAASMPLPANPLHLRSRLMARANQGVRRWLVRERYRQKSQWLLKEADIKWR